MQTTLLFCTLMVAYPVPRDRDEPDKGPGFLGITFEGADNNGVAITEVRPNGPAMQAGLRSMDIIRKFNGDPITFDGFAKRIIRIRPGTIVPVEIQRDSQTLTVKVKVGVRPEDFPYPLPDLEDRPPNIPDLPPPLPPE